MRRATLDPNLEIGPLQSVLRADYYSTLISRDWLCFTQLEPTNFPYAFKRYFMKQNFQFFAYNMFPSICCRRLELKVSENIASLKVMLPKCLPSDSILDFHVFKLPLFTLYNQRRDGITYNFPDFLRKDLCLTSLNASHHMKTTKMPVWPCHFWSFWIFDYL